jgi:protein-tyrosine kinase
MNSMNKRPSLDLVGRLAEHIDLNASPTAEPQAERRPSLPEIAPEVLPTPIVPEPSPVMTRAVDAATLETPTSAHAPDVIIARAMDAVPLDTVTAEPIRTEVKTEAHAANIGLEWDRLYREGYLTPQNQNSLTAEEFRIIKRPLLRAAFNRDGTQRRIGNMAMVTSPCPGDGKTFTSINLSLSIATERDLHVLLVDCDIRRMGLSRALGLTGRPGLMDLLTNKDITFKDVAVRTSIPNLTVIPAGHPIDGSTEIFASQTMAKFVREVSGRYRDRFVIFDAPPVLASSEPGVLAALVGQVVVVVKANETPKRAVAETVNMFDPAVPLNFILNRMPVSSSPDRFGYYEYNDASSDT